MKNLQDKLFLMVGIVGYLLFMLSFVLFTGFVLHIPVLSLMTLAETDPSGYFKFGDLLLNLSLVLLFGLTHSILARRSYKEKLIKFIPKSLERSIYVIIASISVIIMIIFWQPIGGMVYKIDSNILSIFMYVISVIGLIILISSTFLFGHFRFFGVKQAYAGFKGKKPEEPKFQIPLFHNYVRHPLYTGFLIFFWFTPVMTVTHLIFSTLLTIYIFVGTILEEKDLRKSFPDKYDDYAKEVPYRYLPGII